METRRLARRRTAPLMPLVVAALIAGGCSRGDDSASATRASAIRQPSEADLVAAGFDELPLAPRGDRVDLELPPFSDPTNITNPLFPISMLHSVVFSGEVEGKPFHTETTLLPDTRIIEWREGKTVETAVSQYFAYLDGRIQEVALDFYAQADDGSVWYFGEDVFDYDEEGFIESTEGTWLAGREAPPALIMPGAPEVGDVYRAENIPPLAFEEVTVKEVGKTVDGPRGKVSGAMVGEELHLDGTTSDKIFAPGYGEFFSDHDGDLEPLALAVPTDAVDGGAPTELSDLELAAADMFDAVRASRWEDGRTRLASARAAWNEHQAGGVLPLLATEMGRALASVTEAIDARDQARAGTAAIDVAQSALDHRLRYDAPAIIDAARLEVWARQVIIDANAGDLGGMRGAVTTMEWIRDRFAHTIDRADTIRIDTHLMELRNLVNDRDLAGAADEAKALRTLVASVEPAS